MPRKYEADYQAALKFSGRAVVFRYKKADAERYEDRSGTVIRVVCGWYRPGFQFVENKDGHVYLKVTRNGMEKSFRWRRVRDIKLEREAPEAMVVEPKAPPASTNTDGYIRVNRVRPNFG